MPRATNAPISQETREGAKGDITRQAAGKKKAAKTGAAAAKKEAAAEKVATEAATK